MALAASERAGKQNNPPTIPLGDHFPQWSCGRSNQSGLRPGQAKQAAQSSLPLTLACAMEVSPNHAEDTEVGTVEGR
eukprot:6200145-Pleurochrysis_carterae.AAC.1